MEKKMTFNYFYGTEADQFSFYRIPKALFTDSYFKDLSRDVYKRQTCDHPQSDRATDCRDLTDREYSA